MARLSEMQSARRDVIRLIGQLVGQIINDIEENVIAKSRRALFGEDFNLYYELLKNKLIFLDGNKDDFYFLEHYVLLGNYARDPDRIEAMDELKRAIDVAEDLPYSRMILHMGGSREEADPRKRDAAFSTLEHLVLHAHHCGVILCIENTPSEMGAPAYLRAFVDETRLTGLRFNFDIGHAHLCDGPEEERIEKCFEPMRDLVASIHLHDNHGDKDEHLAPYAGNIDWPAAVKLLKTTAAAGNLPIMLELKEKTGPDAPAATELLESARAAMDKFEEEWG